MRNRFLGLEFFRFHKYVTEVDENHDGNNKQQGHNSQELDVIKKVNCLIEQGKTDQPGQ